MDKETLSNYGWIVICVLVLAVMIALATPFGDFVADAVKSTTQGLFDVNQGALDAAGIHIDNNAFADPEKDAALNPDDGTGVSNNKTYVYGNYHYRYNENNGGWAVTLNIADRTLTSYGPILESINGAPIISVSELFRDCVNLTEIPKIPQSVKEMTNTFLGCTSLTDLGDFVIPDNVKKLSLTFYGCTSLTVAPKIPSSVDSMESTFYDCTSLSVPPEIPNGVTDMTSTFRGCSALTTAPTLPDSVSIMSCTFHDCTSLSVPPELPNGVTDLNNAFRGCTALTSAPVIPDSVTNLDRTFAGCTSISGVVFIPCTFFNETKTTLNWHTCPSIKIDFTHNNCSH